jgi:ribonucleoside-diphosphate reductase alpha chain
MMAKIEARFKIFDAKREEKNPFINRFREADPELYDLDVSNTVVVISLA